MDWPDSLITVCRVVGIVGWLALVPVEWRFDHLLRSSPPSNMPVSRGLLHRSGRESLAYIGGVLTRRYATHPDHRVRFWGDFLLAGLGLLTLATVGFAVVTAG